MIHPAASAHTLAVSQPGRKTSKLRGDTQAVSPSERGNSYGQIDRRTVSQQRNSQGKGDTEAVSQPARDIGQNQIATLSWKQDRKGNTSKSGIIYMKKERYAASQPTRETAGGMNKQISGKVGCMGNQRRQVHTRTQRK